MKDLKEFSESVQMLAGSAIHLNSFGYSDEAEEILKLLMLMVRQHKKAIQAKTLSVVSELHPKQ